MKDKPVTHSRYKIYLKRGKFKHLPEQGGYPGELVLVYDLTPPKLLVWDGFDWHDNNVAQILCSTYVLAGMIKSQQTATEPPAKKRSFCNLIKSILRL